MSILFILFLFFEKFRPYEFKSPMNRFDFEAQSSCIKDRNRILEEQINGSVKTILPAKTAWGTSNNNQS